MNWLRNNYTLILIALVAAFLGRNLFPKKVNVGRDVPVIHTVYDTVKTSWTKHDTVKVEHFTTDTFNLIVHQTIHDTVVINVTDSRPNIWQVLSYRTINKDSSSVRTFNLRNGNGASSTIYTPGPLNTLVTDSFPTPHMTFGTYQQFHTGILTKLFYGTLGYSLCEIPNLVKR